MELSHDQSGLTCERVQRDAWAARYLFGDLPPEEQEAFEQHYFSCEACFAQLEEEEDQLLTRYALDDVTEEERQRCEEHFLPDPARQERLAAKRELLAAIRETQRQTTASAPIAAADFAVKAQPFASFWRVAAVSAVVLLGAATIFFAWQNLQTRRALRATEQRLAESERARQEQQRPRDAAPPLTEATPNPQPAASERPPVALVNPPFVQLLPAHRAGQGELTRVTLPARNTTVIFYLEYEAAEPQHPYHLALRDAHNKVLWQATNARPRDHSSFVITLPSELLHAGQHTFQLSEQEDQRFTPRANYSFRVIRH